MKLVYRDEKGAPLTNGEVDSNFDIASKYLETIEETKSVTAVDVFVYDTSKDSDGGAWRQRTQGTSWYNETLNTATRGSRKEFPAVAVIVAESTRVTIYDGDDPSLPMWMVFSSGGYTGSADFNALAGAGAVITAVTAHNGILSAVSNTTRCGLSMVQFLADRVWAKDTLGLYNGNISQRNAGKHISSVQYASSGLVNANANDVAMTVLPDAPIDPATGLPIPTIAVATDGGVSVIKDDGTVVDSNNTTASSAVTFNTSGVWFSASSGTRLFYADYSSLTSDGFSVNKVGDTDGVSGDFIPVVRAELLASGDNSLTLGCDSATELAVVGLAIHAPNYINQSEGASALITSKYNTGWMNGDVKLATLSDTDDTDLVGSELLDQASDLEDPISEWTLGVGTASITNASQFHFLQIKPNGSKLPVGHYVITFTVASGGTTYGMFSNAENGYLTSGLSSGNYVVQLNQTSVAEVKFVINQGDSVSITNLSVRLAEPDRSVNNNGLQVFGTVVRTPVATGADLVGYSGFNSGLNYFEQPYNPDLDFGTGDFCVMWWASPTNDTYYTLIDNRNDSLTTGLNVQTVPEGSTSKIRVYLQNIYRDSLEIPELVSSSWSCFCVVRKGDTLSFYVNGRLHSQQVESSIGDRIVVKNDESPMRIGVRKDGQQSLSGSLALLRISGTAPTAEQIAKIYRDEKVLFQENAKATLHGTSDAVTALAYDEEEQILRVGTSSGRSDFSGLRRVSNTTTGVATAISSSGGMVVEQ